MKPTDTSEKELERLIVRHLAGISEHPLVMPNAVREPEAVYAPGGYVLGQAGDYNRDVALDVAKLLEFLHATQPRAVETLDLAADGIQRTQFLHRLQGEIAKRGVVDVLRKGIAYGSVSQGPISTRCCPRREMPSPPKPSTRTFSASPARCATATIPATSWIW